jgi:hypothetical protein
MRTFVANKMAMVFFMLFVTINFANANTGDLFSISGSGLAATLDVQLCLSVSGATPWNCENHTVTRQSLSIRTLIPNHTYPAAGIKLLTSGYSLTGCTFLSNGYCQFTASNTNAASIITSSLTTPHLTSVMPSSGTALGNVGVTLTGTNLTGATAVSFGGVAATSVNVVSDTTVTAVTPANAAGIVDVVITTPHGSSTLTDGYIYQATAVGQASGGGVIACLENDNNLIAATADNTDGIVWGGIGIDVGDANSNTDGASNTIAIVTMLGNNGGTPYAAKLCSDYEVDSQGNTPCQDGNTCYDDWFLPAGNNVTDSGQLNCLYVNNEAIGGISDGNYWSSTQGGDAAHFAYIQDLLFGNEMDDDKNGLYKVRCVRDFTS